MESLSSVFEGNDTYSRDADTLSKWLTPIPITVDTRRRHHKDVLQDPGYTQRDPPPTTEAQSARRPLFYIPAWVFPIEETQSLFDRGHGTAPNLIYARGATNTPSPGPITFDKKLRTLIFFEI
jgi:hypothetical protein